MTEVEDDFATLTRAYRFNLSEYRVTGNVANKTAYELAQRGIEDRIEARKNNIGQNQQYIRDFLAKYQDTNKTLVDLHEKSRFIQSEGPRLQDEYIAAQQRAPSVDAVDNTTLYVKGAIVLGLMTLIALVATG
jgi:hypothetical protein